MIRLAYRFVLPLFVMSMILIVLVQWVAPAIHPGGSVVFASGDRQRGIVLSDLFTIDLERNLYQQITNNRSEFEPDVSSLDGSIVYVSRSPVYSTGEIFKVDVDGRNITQLTDGIGNPSAPAWSPDGKQIVFASARDHKTNLFIMDADGDNLRQLTFDSKFDAAPAWSPDGKQIAFHSNRGGNTKIYVMNADGTDIRQIANLPQTSRQPAWSPDGEQIVFVSVASPAIWDVFVTDLDGNNMRQVTDSQYRNVHPEWSPDGTQIMFESIRSTNTFRLFTVSVEATEPDIQMVDENYNYLRRLLNPLANVVGNDFSDRSGSLPNMTVSWAN